MQRAAIFPGQGAQAVGMGKMLVDTYEVARAVFDEVDDALGERLSAIIFEGPGEVLQQTATTQPALFATSMAAVRVLEQESGRSLGGLVDAVAGHSLGEYSALAAAGSLGIGDGARLLRLRGRAMQEAVAEGEGAMAAILGVDAGVAEAIAREAAGDEVCEVANDNGEGQAVISGHRAAVDRAIGLARARGAKRSVLLQVSAPFHCTLMLPAAERLGEALAEVRIGPPSVPVIANVTAAPVSDPDAIRDLLARQVTARVRWREIMAAMAAAGVTAVVELGAGKVLSGLARRGLAGARVASLQEPGDVEGCVRLLGAAA